MSWCCFSAPQHLFCVFIFKHLSATTLIIKKLLPQIDGASAISLQPIFQMGYPDYESLDTLAALLNQDRLWWQVLPNVVAAVTGTWWQVLPERRGRGSGRSAKIGESVPTDKNVCATYNESNCSVLWGKYLQIRIIINIIAEDMTCRPRILSKRWHPFRSVPLTYN